MCNPLEIISVQNQSPVVFVLIHGFILLSLRHLPRRYQLPSQPAWSPALPSEPTCLRPTATRWWWSSPQPSPSSTSASFWWPCRSRCRRRWGQRHGELPSPGNRPTLLLWVITQHNMSPLIIFTSVCDTWNLLHLLFFFSEAQFYFWYCLIIPKWPNYRTDPPFLRAKFLWDRVSHAWLCFEGCFFCPEDSN